MLNVIFTTWCGTWAKTLSFSSSESEDRHLIFRVNCLSWSIGLSESISNDAWEAWKGHSISFLHTQLNSREVKIIPEDLMWSLRMILIILEHPISRRAYELGNSVLKACVWYYTVLSLNYVTSEEALIRPIVATFWHSQKDVNFDLQKYGWLVKTDNLFIHKELRPLFSYCAYFLLESNPRLPYVPLTKSLVLADIAFYIFFVVIFLVEIV